MTVPKGSLPVFSVSTEEEARSLILAACGRTDKGEHFARELAEEQTLENLEAFSVKLAQVWFDCMGREPERLEDGGS